jgi:hypothetical protein
MTVVCVDFIYLYIIHSKKKTVINILLVSYKIIKDL